MDTQRIETQRTRAREVDEQFLRMYDRFVDAIAATVIDDERERDRVLCDLEPETTLEVLLARVKTLRMQERTLRNEVHELEDAKLALLRREHER